MHAYNVNQNSYDYYHSELDEFDTQAARIKPESIDNLVKLTKFNKRELKLMYRGFKQLCPSGVVKEDKFKLIYAQFFPRGAETNGYARYVFNSFDVQHKQEITFTDFVIGLSVLTRGTVDERLRWIFTLYDINGDGVITRDELNRIVNSIHDLMGKLALTPGQAALLQEQQQQQSQSSSSQNTNRSANSNQQSSQQQQPQQQQQQQRQRQSSLSSLTLQTQTTTAPNNNNGQQKDFLLQPTRSSEAQLESLFMKFDLNNDGMITLDEFIEACREDENIIRSISVFNTVL